MIAFDAHETVHLRAVLGIAQRQGRRIRAPHPDFPDAARLAYLAELLDIVRECNAIVRREVLARLPEFFEPTRADAKSKRPKDDVDAWLRNVDVRLTEVVPAARSRRAAKVAASKINGTNRRSQVKQFKQALGIDLRARDANVDAAMRGFVKENVALIQSIPKKLHADVRKLVDTASTTGMRVETLAARIEDRFGVTESRAKLIARDQTNKLNGQLTQLRQEAVGIDEYDWSTSHDERVRPDHARLDGKVQKWSRPPIVDRRTGRRAHPGGDYQCRCNALPRFEKLLDRLEADAGVAPRRRARAA